VGQTGETPTIVIQRLSDGLYYDDQLVSGSRFAAAYADNAMSEVSATNFPGAYRYQFPHSEDTTGSELFFLRYINTGVNARLVYEEIAFGPLRTAASLERCNLYGTVLALDGSSIANEVVYVTIIPNTILTSGSKPGISVQRIEMYTDANGGFSVDILRNLVVRLQIPSMGYDAKITIPDQESANFADL
jgi:hypothetical protein